MGSLSKMSGNCELRKRYMPGGIIATLGVRSHMASNNKILSR